MPEEIFDESMDSLGGVNKIAECAIKWQRLALAL
jgi:hypothetical protein